MSHSESRRGGGWFLAAVCALLALAAVYCLNSRNKGKSNTGEELSPTAPSVVVSPTPEPPSPTPTPPSPPSSPQDLPRASVSGTVRFADSNEPVSGTLVQLAWENGFLSSQTDTSGSYTFSGLPSPVKLWITAENQQAGYFMYDTSETLFLKGGESIPGQDLWIYIGRKGSISGNVSGSRICLDPSNDGQTTLPLEWRYRKKETNSLPGIEIHLSRISHLKETEQMEITDENGFYQFENLAPAEYLVEVIPPLPDTVYTSTSESFTQVAKVVQNTKTGINFKYELDAVSVSGRVTDEEGKPLAGISVFEGSHWGTGTDIPYVEISGETDAEGRYRLTRLPPASFLTAARYLSAGTGDDYYKIALSGGETFREIPTITEDSLHEGMRFLEIVAQNADKASRVPELAEIPEGNIPKSRGHEIVDVDFVLPGKSSVSGYVVDSDGKPIPKERFGLEQVVLHRSQADIKKLPGQQFSEENVEYASIDGDGSFRFSDVPSGRYALKVYRERNTCLERELTTLTLANNKNIENIRVEINLSKYSSSLEFKVLNALTKEALEHFNCNLQYNETSERYLPVNGGMWSREKSGDTVHFEHLPTGKAKLSIVSSPYGDGGSYNACIDIEIQAGETVLGPILLEPVYLGGMVGHVQNSDSGTPIKMFEILQVVEREPGFRAVDGLFFIPDRSKPGTFRTGLRPGEHTLEISSPGYAPQILKVQIRKEEVTEQTIQMKPEGRLVGRVMCGEVPSENYAVFTRPIGKRQDFYVSGNYWTNRQGQNTGDGCYKCSNLGEDEQQVTVECSYSDSARIRYTIRQFDTVQVKSGEESRKDFQFKENAGIEGSIEAPFWSKGMVLEVQDGQSEWFNPELKRVVARLKTDLSNTSYQIRYLLPGTYSVVLTYRDEQYQEHRMQPRTVTLQPGRIETVDIAN